MYGLLWKQLSLGWRAGDSCQSLRLMDIFLLVQEMVTYVSLFLRLHTIPVLLDLAQ